MALDQDSALQQAAAESDQPAQDASDSPDYSAGTAQPDSSQSQSQDQSQAQPAGGGLETLAQPDDSSLPLNGSNLAATMGITSTPNVPSPSEAPLKGVGGRLRGVLYGIATGGVLGAIPGAIDPNYTRTRYEQDQQKRAANVQEATAKAQSATNNVQFESVRAADSHIQAMKEAQRIDQMNEESRAQVRDLNDKHAQFLMDTNTFGIVPDLTLEGNGQEVHDQATGGLTTLAAENGGQIPPIAANVQPHTADQPKFKVSVYSPSQQDFQKNQAGYRKAVDTSRAVMGTPPIDDASWNAMGFKGRREQSNAAIQMLSPIQPFTESNIGSVLAARKQMLAAYQAHTDASGNPDADPKVVAQLQQSVDFLTNAQKDVNSAASKKAAEEEAAKEKAALPYKLAQAKAEEALKDGDPNAAGQLLFDGDVSPSQLVSSRKPAFAQQAFTAARNIAKQNGSNWNAQSAEGFFKVAGSPANVQFFTSTKSLTDQGGTLDQLENAYNKLPNGQIPAFNKVSDWSSAAAGSGLIAGFAQTAIGVADDYAKVMGGGQGSDTSRNQALESFAASHSPAQMKAAIAAARMAVDSQMQSRIGKNPVMRKMYGDQMLIHVTDPKGEDHVFRTQEQADAFRKAAGIS